MARPSMERDKDHWVHEGYRQRVDYKSWRNILLNHEDSIIFKGKIRYLRARDLGYGVVEIYKETLGD